MNHYTQFETHKARVEHAVAAAKSPEAKLKAMAAALIQNCRDLVAANADQATWTEALNATEAAVDGMIADALPGKRP